MRKKIIDIIFFRFIKHINVPDSVYWLVIPSYSNYNHSHVYCDPITETIILYNVSIVINISYQFNVRPFFYCAAEHLSVRRTRNI